MSLIPNFEIGIWNAWFITIYFLLVGMLPGFFIDADKAKKLENIPPYNKIEKRLALTTHVFIMPVLALYSIFLPLRLSTVWLYIGLPVCFLGGMLILFTYIGINKTATDMPVISGVYRLSRHPMYFGQFLLYLGMGIACASWIVLLFAVIWIVIWIIVVPTEEQQLVDLYGEAYRSYLNKTPRWIGFIKNSGNHH